MTDLLILPSQVIISEALQHWVGVQLSNDPKYLTEHMYQTESEGSCKYCIIFDNIVKSIEGLVDEDELPRETAYYLLKAREALDKFK